MYNSTYIYIIMYIYIYAVCIYIYTNISVCVWLWHLSEIRAIIFHTPTWVGLKTTEKSGVWLVNPGPPFNGRRGQIGDHQVPELARDQNTPRSLIGVTEQILNAPGQSSYFKPADWSTQTFCSTIFLTSAQATAIGKKQIDCPSDLLVSAYAKLGLSICSLPVAQQGFFIRQANLCILPISHYCILYSSKSN